MHFFFKNQVPPSPKMQFRLLKNQLLAIKSQNLGDFEVIAIN